MTFTCPNCGAVCDNTQPRCPYCGTLIPEGAQQEYMEKLSALREDMAELGAAPGAAVKAELRRQGRRIRRICTLLLAAAAILALLMFLQDKRWQRDNTADYIWQHENYPYMTELYEAGDFETLRDFCHTAMEEDRPIWDWEYCDEFFARLEEMP